jgi:hypothetical protein
MPIIAGRASAAYGAGFAAITAPPYLGPFGAYDSLASVTVGTATATITFTGIPSGYRHLQLRGIALSSSSSNGVAMRFNGDSTANYSLKGLEGSGASATSYGSANGTTNNAGYTGDATYPGIFVCDILDYASTTKNKTVRAITGNDANGAVRYASLLSGAYYSTNAINTITIFHGASVNFNTYSSFALYGVK